MRTIINSLFISILFFVIGCSDDNGSSSTGPTNQYEASETFDFAYEVGATQLEMTSIAGSINIIGVDGLDSIYIEGTRRVISDVSQTDADNRLSNFGVQITNSLPVFYIETLQQQDTEGRQYLIDYEIRMPADLALNVVNVTGLVTISDITGNIFATNDTGDIDVACEIQDGGSVNLITVAGAISLNIPVGTSATLQANVATGNIELHNLVLNDSVITTRSVTGSFGNGNGSIVLSASAGDIDVTGF